VGGWNIDGGGGRVAGHEEGETKSGISEVVEFNVHDEREHSWMGWSCVVPNSAMPLEWEMFFEGKTRLLYHEILTNDTP